jgi:GNAT superfamily N-acetyltransferase
LFEIEVNPPGVEAEYLRGLNLCFGRWGDAPFFDWCFRRPGWPAADLIVARGEQGLLSGSAVTYRTVLLPNGRRLFSGTVTGSWALPAARGQGVFQRLLAACVQQAAARGAPTALSWTTVDNTSTRGVQRLGAGQFASVYASSGPGTPVPAAALPVGPPADADGALEAMLAELGRGQEGYARIGYTPAEWRAQFLARPAEVELLAIGDAGWAAVERAGEWDRVQALVPAAPDALAPCLAALLRRAAGAGRRLFVFSTLPTWMEQLAALGLEARPGYLSVMVGDPAGLGRVLADEPLPPFAFPRLEDPADPWYMGPWNVQGGDRM